MSGMLSQLMAAESPVVVIVFAILVTFLFIKELYAAVKWLKDRFDGYYNARNSIEKKDETIEGRIGILESHDSWQYKKLNELGTELKEVINMLKKVQDTQSQTIIDTYRNIIFRIYHDNIKQGFITQTELDRFIVLVTKYKEAGGDGIVDEKVYPEIMALPIGKK